MTLIPLWKCQQRELQRQWGVGADAAAAGGFWYNYCSY